MFRYLPETSDIFITTETFWHMLSSRNDNRNVSVFHFGDIVKQITFIDIQKSHVSYCYN